jgi:Zn-dependent protease
MIDQEMLAAGLLWYVAFLLSLTCHEAAHALVAMWGGDMTAAEAGQVSLNPIPHMQRAPFGTIVVPLLTYALQGWMLGWASAPYDPYWQARHPHRAAWMALAGPIANLLLALGAAIAIHAGISMGDFEAPQRLAFDGVVAAAAAGSTAEALAKFLSILFSLNLLLMSFNLLPVPPLDGNTAIGLLMSESAALKFYEFSRQPGFMMIGLLIAWNVFGQLFHPIFLAAVNALYFVRGLSYG